MFEEIATDAHYRQMLKRVVALKDHATAIRDVQALASANRHIGSIEPEDLRDIAALDDALADIGYTLRGLESAIADWEAFESYGSRDDPAAERAWHRRRVL